MRGSWNMNRRNFLFRTFLFAAAPLAGSHAFGAPQHRYKLAPEAWLPKDIRSAPDEVREAYRFAIINQDTLRYIPCYCGCERSHEQGVMLPKGRFDPRKSAIRSHEPGLRDLHRHHA